MLVKSVFTELLKYIMTSKYEDQISTKKVIISVTEDKVHVTPKETYIIKEKKDTIWYIVGILFICIIVVIIILCFR
jgi:small-conductance mechanosensitive channel